ncbi:MAG TPA: type II secretion system protein GspJ [Gammaproteobacteria bacterium]|nr:type II secretion system protein GspJ [Gammaproteobacteria bacterium]
MRHAPCIRMPSRKVSATRGFTLLELLLGMAVLALMAGIVLGGIRLGVKSWDAAAERSAAVEEMRVVHALLRRQLSSALPLATSRAGGWNLVFEGDPQSLRFVSELPGYVSGGGIHFVTLALAKGAEGDDLVLRWRPLHALDADEPPDEAVLARNVEKLRLRYFGARTRNALSEWLESWRDSRTLPRLIEISLEQGGGESWPELVVALDVDAVRFITSEQDRDRLLPNTDPADDAVEQPS